MKRLSVCMIVKDEEALLPRCLGSVQDIADEIIIIDTGSTDRTKQIAEEYGAKLFDYSWTNDFAAARNESLRHATGDWILVLDADEYLAEDEHQKWKGFLEQEKPSNRYVYSMDVINFTGDNEFDDEITTAPITRLLPNSMGIHFEGPIHEQLTRGHLGVLIHKHISLNIYHTGYQTQRIVEKNKHERNMSIFNEMKKNKKFSDYDWFTLGNQHRFAKEEEEALRCYERALTGSDPRGPWTSHCLMGLITLYFKRGDLKTSWKWTEKQLSKYSKYSEYPSIKGIHYEKMGFFEEAVVNYLEAIRIAERRAQNKQEIWLVDPMYSFEMPVQQLVETYFRLNNNEQAIFWLTKLLQKNNKNLKVLLKLVEWLCHNEEPASVIGFLDKIYNKNNKVDSMLLFKVALVLSQIELVRYYEQFIGDINRLSLLDQVRYTIIAGNDQNWKMLQIKGDNLDSRNELQLWIQLAIGAMKWNTFEKLEQYAERLNNEEISTLTKIVKIMFEEHTIISEELLKGYADQLFLIAKQLFLLKEFEVFDRFISLMKTSELINQMANYFYSLNLTEMAMNYFSILLSEQKLDVVSLVNLGLFHYNHGYKTDAEQFLNEAVKLQPSAKHLYYSLIQSASKEHKSLYIKQFIDECSECMDISFVHKFIVKEK